MSLSKSHVEKNVYTLTDYILVKLHYSHSYLHDKPTVLIKVNHINFKKYIL